MKLQNVLEATQLSKKAVYFYIKEELINPSKNIENGYYDFSDEDLKRLQIITCLRKGGMPIQDIKELIAYPTLTNFFIHRHINRLKKDIYEHINELQVAYYMIDKIPTNATPENLDFSLEILCRQQFNADTVLDKYYPNLDSRMIAILIWAAFTNIETSEYHNFLWDKISNELSFQLDNKLIYLKRLIYCLSPEQIYKTSAEAYEVSKEISESDEDKLDDYVEFLYERCIEIIKDSTLQKYWQLVYEPILVPTLAFFNSNVDRLIKEYNPQYTSYSNNMHIIADRTLLKLKSNPSIMRDLIIILDNKLSMETINHHIILCLYTFKNSIFTQLELDRLRELLNEI